ncbi:MAG: hypothetical protein AAFY55_18155, partial [Bacteroidota bacterium]
MMIPYFDRVGVGLCVSQEAASMVVWRRRFGRVRLREERLVSLGDNPVEALRQLKDASPQPFIHVAVPDALLACEVVPVPDFDEPEDRDAWATSEAERRGTPFRDGTEVVVTAQIFEVPVQSESDAEGRLSASQYSASRSGVGYIEEVARYRAVLCVLDRTRIEATLGLLREAGFVVERVASGLVEAATLPLLPASQAVEDRAYDSEASTGQIWLGEHTLPRVEILSPARLVVEGAFGTAELDVAVGRPHSILMHTPRADEDLARGTYEDEGVDGSSDAESAHIQYTRASLVSITGLRPSSAMASAIAYEALYPGLVVVQALPRTTQQGVKQTRRVEEGKRATLFVAGTVLALLVLLIGAELGISAFSSRTAAQLQEQAPALALLERDRAEVARMERDLRLAERAQAERTTVAFYLEALARAVPDGVTLTEVVIGPVDGVTSSTHHAIAVGESQLLSRVLFRPPGTVWDSP